MSDAAYQYRKAIKDATDTYTWTIKELWETHGRPVPITVALANEWTCVWTAWLLARLKADHELDKARSECEGTWADDGGKNL